MKHVLYVLVSTHVMMLDSLCTLFTSQSVGPWKYLKINNLRHMHLADN